MLTRSRCSWGIACAAACALVSLTAAAAEPPETRSSYLQDGDRVVFYGDSITEQAHYTLPIETYVRTRCSDLDVSFINSGWGGDRAWGGDGGMLDERLRRDVVAHRPTVVTVMLGMNDGYYTNFDPTALTAFKKSLKSLVETLKRDFPGVRITLIGTSPYDNVTPGEQPDWERGIDGGYDSVITHYSAAAREVAEDQGLLFVDMHEPLVRLLEKLQAADPKLARQLIPDRIHPEGVAGLVMAGRLLNAWHLPDPSGEIEVDASEMQSTGTLKIERKLPLPFPCDRNDPLLDLVARQSGDLNRFLGGSLRVAHLPFAKAFVAIDGQKCGPFSAEQLNNGIALAAHDSPPVRRAAAVARLVALRNQVQMARWRTLECPSGENPPTAIQESAQRVQEVEKELADSAIAIAKPQTHIFEVIGAKE